MTMIMHAAEQEKYVDPDVLEARRKEQELNESWDTKTYVDEETGETLSAEQCYEREAKRSQERHDRMAELAKEVVEPTERILFVDMVELGTVGKLEFRLLNPRRRELALLAQTGQKHVSVSEYQSATMRHMLGFNQNDLRFQTYKPLMDSELRSLPKNCVGIVFSGSEANLVGTNPRHNNMIKAVSNLINMAKEQGIPMFGICFGSQILNNSFGSEINWIKPADTKYEEVGMVKLEKTAAGKLDPLLKDVPDDKLVIMASHLQHVDPSKAAQDLIILASSKDSEVHIARLKNDHSIFTVQGHPEVTSALVDISYDISGDRPEEDNELFQGRSEQFSEHLLASWLRLIKLFKQGK